MATTEPGREAQAASDAPSMEALARRFLDLWQSHVAALAADPETNLLLGRLIETQIVATEALVRATRLAGAAAAHDGAAPDAGAARPETAAAPPRDGERDLAELARRLAACEERLARLEKRPAGRRGGARKSARRRSG